MKICNYLIVLYSLTLFSCGPKTIFEKKTDVDGFWTYQKTLSFSFDITDTIPAHDILLDVEHSKDFFYQNIYTKVTTVFPDQKKVDHIISLNLTTQNNRWVGDCSAQKCKAELVLSENIYFNQTGNYTIALEQYGRKDTLAGIESMSLKVIQHREK
ncbi:MAG: gliding motility lipoprotein GldH [Saprospiraceae bacterium]|nr:gliding motility lipoprotein GldH [Saprospiraceae bacterium]